VGAKMAGTAFVEIADRLFTVKVVWMIVRGRKTGYSRFTAGFLFLMITSVMNWELCCKCS